MSLKERIFKPEKTKKFSSYDTNPELLDNLEKMNAAISFAELEKILASVTGPADFAMDQFTTHVSTLENPCVIYENAATFCSLLIGFDTTGNVVSLHVPLITETTDTVQALLEQHGFLEQAQTWLKPDKQFFVTGTGSSMSTQELRSQLVTQLEEILGQKVNFLFLSDLPPYEHETPAQTLGQRARHYLSKLLFGMFTGENAFRLDLQDVIIVPKALSKSEKTELFLPYSPTLANWPVESHRRMGDFLRELREKISG